MADPKSKSGGAPPAPSFYAKAGEMAAADTGGSGAGKPSTPQGQVGEKVQSVKALLEIFSKMDAMEQDPDSKSLIQQMASTAQEYMSKLEGKSGKKGPASTPATGEAGSGGGMGTQGTPPPPDAAMGGGGGMTA